jgi:ABC-type amino acid transport substrate-binding protein
MVDKDSGTSMSLLDEILERGFIRIAAYHGTDYLMYFDPDTGEAEGFVGRVGKMLAKDLGVRPTFVIIPRVVHVGENVDYPWVDQLPYLLDGRVDIMLKHGNTPRRCLEAEFATQSILTKEAVIVVRRDGSMFDERDLNQPGRVVAVWSGSSQEYHARERFPLAEVRGFSDDHDICGAVAAREVDACLPDDGVPAFFAAHPECVALPTHDGRPFVAYCIHPCIKPGDQRFLNWLNSWIAFRKAQEGVFQRVLEAAKRDFEAKRERIEFQ